MAKIIGKDRAITGKLLGDMGITKALMKKIKPYMKKIRDGIDSGDTEKIRSVVGKKISGEFSELVRMNSEQKEIFGDANGKKWAVWYNIEFTRNSETRGQVRGGYETDTRAITIRIDAETPALMIENEDFHRLGSYSRLTSDIKIMATIRHEVTHAIRDAHTGHIKRVVERRKREPKYDEQYRGPRGHLDPEYEVDAIVNELDGLRSHIGRRKWDEMGPKEIENLFAQTDLLFPKVGDPAFLRWVKRLKREGLLTTGMMKEWRLGKYRNSVAKIAKVEILDKQRIKKFRKDFLILMKNVKVIDGYDKAHAWRKYVIKWTNGFRDYVFEYLLEQIQKLSYRKLHEGGITKPDAKYWEDYIRKNVWPLTSDIRVPIDLVDDYLTKEVSFYRFEQQIIRWERRVRNSARKAWNALNEFVSWYEMYSDQKVQVDVPAEENIELAGFTVRLKGTDKSVLDVKKQVKRLEEGLRIYKKGMSRIPPLKRYQLPIVFDFGCRMDLGGVYKYDHIIVCDGEKPNRLAHVIAHEMGHHLYRAYLSGKDISFWEKAISGNYGELDLNEVLKKYGSESWFIDNSRIKREDPIMFLQLNGLLSGNRNWLELKELATMDELREYVERTGRSKAKVMVKPITGYAHKSPEEAFCETVGLFVAYGKKALHQEVLGWLRMIIPQVKTSAEIPDGDLEYVAPIKPRKKDREPAKEEIKEGNNLLHDRVASLNDLPSFSSVDDMRTYFLRMPKSELSKLQTEADALYARATAKYKSMTPLFHGAPQKIIEKIRAGGFQLTQGERSGFMGYVKNVQNLAVFLSEDKQLARAFGTNRDPYGGSQSGVVEVRAKIKKTLNMTKWGKQIPTEIRKTGLRLIEEDSGEKPRKPRQDEMFWLIDQPEFVKTVESAGYDSVRFSESTATKNALGLNKTSGDTIAVFDVGRLHVVPLPSDTVKSLTGLFNHLKERNMKEAKQLEGNNLLHDHTDLDKVYETPEEYMQYMKGEKKRRKKPSRPDEHAISESPIHKEGADKIPGGLADKKSPKDFDQKAINKGIKVEMEHTDDKDLAREITMDHLTEDKNYYDKLEKVEGKNSSVASELIEIAKLLMNVDR